MAKASTEVAIPPSAGAVMTYAGLEQYAGQGLDDLTAQDRSIPFLKILEKNSPECETVEGARPGMWINTATLQLYTTVRFVPVCRDHLMVEWVPIDAGGGLVASYGMDQPISVWALKQRGKIKLRNGNDLVDTFYLYGIVVPEPTDDEAEPYVAVIAFTSTRIKAYKTIVDRSNAIMLIGGTPEAPTRFKAPWFCHIWRLGTEKKVDGAQSWYIPTAAFDSPGKDALGARIPEGDPLLLLGSEVIVQHANGELKVSQEAAAGEQPDESTYSGTPGAPQPSQGGGSGGARNDRRAEEDPPF